MEKPSEFEINIRNVDVRLNDSCTTESNMNGDVDNSLYISSPVETEAQIKLFKNESTDKYLETVSEASKIYQQCKDSSSGLLNGCHKTMHEEIKRVDFTMNGINKCNNLELLNSQLDKLNFRTCEQTVGEHDEDTRTNLNSKESTSVNPSCFIPELSSSEISNSSKVNTTCDAQDVKTDITKLKSDPKDEILKDVNIIYLGYDSEKQMPDIMRLIQKDLSEPYSIYTYRYFIHNWPKLCFLAQYEDQCVGAIVCKLDVHKKQCRRGYIAMLAVDKKYRKRKIGSNLVLKAIQAMVEDNADEVVLETEITNKSALRLYENLGFVRDKRLFRYYLNGVDALRLKLWLR